MHGGRELFSWATEITQELVHCMAFYLSLDIISLGHFGHLVGVSRFFSKEINPLRDGQTNELTDAQTIYAVTPLRELVVGCRTQNDSNILHCEEPTRRS